MVELTSSFTLEIQSLDRDHQRLADIVNQVIKAIDDGAFEKCEPLVADFVRSAKEHFINEEALLIRVGYPDARKHHDHHKSLNTNLEHMIEFAKMAPENQMARDSLRKELTYILMDDVITTDMDFKNFITDKERMEKN